MMGPSFELILTREDAAMNRNSRFVGGRKGLVAASVLASVAVMTVSAAPVVTYDTELYDPQTTAYANGAEIGDDVQMDPDITYAGLTQFKFSYTAFGLLLPDDASITFRLYKLDGANGTPGTQLFEQSGIPMQGSSAGPLQVTLDLGTEAAPLWTPSNIGWTVEFLNTHPIYTNPGLVAANTTVGSSLNTYFVKTSSGWELAQLSGGSIPGTFEATVLAVPEPSVTQLGLIGLVMLFGGRFLRRK